MTFAGTDSHNNSQTGWSSNLWRSTQHRLESDALTRESWVHNNCFYDVRRSNSLLFKLFQERSLNYLPYYLNNLVKFKLSWATNVIRNKAGTNCRLAVPYIFSTVLKGNLFKKYSLEFSFWWSSNRGGWVFGFLIKFQSNCRKICVLLWSQDSGHILYRYSL